MTCKNKATSLSFYVSQLSDRYGLLEKAAIEVTEAAYPLERAVQQMLELLHRPLITPPSGEACSPSPITVPGVEPAQPCCHAHLDTPQKLGDASPCQCGDAPTVTQPSLQDTMLDYVLAAQTLLMQAGDLSPAEFRAAMKSASAVMATWPEWEKADFCPLRPTYDQYGRYDDVNICGVVQRFRWIKSGVFLMGSPDDEPCRDRDENQHWVELTQGFWLADTACTQELWEAVMGENPSRFKGAKHPVENVSHDDCQKFIAKINKAMPGLEVKLPTEAEWEYACRAGTTTPFSFGDNINTDQVNYDGRYPYAGGEKGQYRKETVEVKTFKPNGWGLYEMHGNVGEWCADWYGSYKKGERVLRGGSWFNNGGYCRSAYRSRNSPDNRYDFNGFRLAVGEVI